MTNLVTPKELASELQVPLSTIYRWNADKTGPTPYRIGRHIRFRRDDVDAWLAGKAEKRTADV